MTPDMTLRDVTAADLPLFYDQQLDPDANHMAAFTAKDPTDRQAFTAHWERIMANPTGMIKTIVVEDTVVGYVLSYEEDGRPEVSYWLGKAYWGQGIATRALDAFLTSIELRRPIYGRVAKDNPGSLRVLQKNGFRVIGEDAGFANARNCVTEEFILQRD